MNITNKDINSILELIANRVYAFNPENSNEYNYYRSLYSKLKTLLYKPDAYDLSKYYNPSTKTLTHFSVEELAILFCVLNKEGRKNSTIFFPNDVLKLRNKIENILFKDK